MADGLSVRQKLKSTLRNWYGSYGQVNILLWNVHSPHRRTRCPVRRILLPEMRNLIGQRSTQFARFHFLMRFLHFIFKVVEEMMAPFGIKRENIDGRILKSEIIWRTFQKFSAIWPYYGHHWSRHNSLVNSTDYHE